MRLLYDLFFLIFSLLYIPYLLVKGKVHRDFLQKFSFLPKDVTDLKRPVWIHAVSVGEAALAAKLSAGIKKRFPDVAVMVSTTTQTGNDMIRKSAEGALDAIFYYPLDIRYVVSRVVRLLNPRLYVMIETELWPNLLEELNSREIPVILANGRISDNSFANYKRIRFIMRRILGCIDCFCMQSGKDAERIGELGAPLGSIFVTGNMKFDERTPLADAGGIGKEDLGFSPDDEVIVAGSTHFPEEGGIIDIYKRLRAKKDNLKLVLAPRHVERTDAIRIYIEKSDLKYLRFSDVLKGAPDEKCDILLVDTIGHLKDLYSVATVVFVGGSLAKKGGQNPIEAARWEKTIVFGPHMFNFREVSDIFLESKAAAHVKDFHELEKVLGELLEDPEARKGMAENARKVIEANSGTIDKTVDKIAEYLKG
ncbi:MAG: 3-deoxy-D-manno-octulosonic acid transferase [Candidatus Omnitrophota bacterium]